MKVLDELLYSKEHEWVKKDGEKAYIGITDFAQDSMGTITHLGLPQPGTSFLTGQSYGVIDSVEESEHMNIPVGGKIIEINKVVAENPSLLNGDPYKHWIVKVDNIKDSQLKNLMNAAEYEEFCAEKM